MKTLFFCSFVLFAACNSAPDGVVVDGDEARVATLALLEVYDDNGTTRANWKPDRPDANIVRWLSDHEYKYSHFEPDTTRGKIAGDFWKPVYLGFLIYRK